MLKRFFLLTTIFFLFTILIQGCATKGYIDAMKAGSELERQEEYIKAYNEYKKALEEKPDDKEALAKLETIGKRIAENFITSGNRYFSGGYYRDAENEFTNALKYQTDNNQARRALAKLAKAQKEIRSKFDLAETLKAENKWVELHQLLQDIQKIYKDASDLPDRIQETEDRGYQYFSGTEPCVPNSRCV